MIKTSVNSIINVNRSFPFMQSNSVGAKYREAADEILLISI